MSKFYIGWAALVLGLFCAMNLFGWTITDEHEDHQIPKSIRDNPGAYRSHYTGGK
ncbi:MAG: hypothetical protein HYY17_12685 [Planctomycetes bacterium]|nr:hypothetical protein [Planctomycetota bacterium]